MQNDVEPLETVSLRIKNMRKTLGVSQKRLATLIGMSQSTIARLESDIKSLNPSYLTVYKVIESLNGMGKVDEKTLLLNKKASSIMHKNIVFAKPSNTVAEAIEMIKDYDFPQLPVLNSKGRAAGTVYQKDLLTIATQRPDEIGKIKIEEIIEPSLPQIDKNTSLTKLKPVLENWNAVLVTEDDKIIGIITIYDILKLV